MKTLITFQYKKDKNSRPDDMTFPDVLTEVKDGAGVPNVGDIVTMMGFVEYKKEEAKRDLFTCKVIARHYFYSYKEYPEDSTFGECQIFIIVEPVKGGELGVDIKE